MITGAVSRSVRRQTIPENGIRDLWVSDLASKSSPPVRQTRRNVACRCPHGDLCHGGRPFLASRILSDDNGAESASMIGKSIVVGANDQGIILAAESEAV